MATENNQNLNKIIPTNDCANKSTQLNDAIAVNLSNKVHNKETTNTDAISCNDVPFDEKTMKRSERTLKITIVQS